MTTIRVGIIGWGFMGKTHAHALREMPLFYPGAGFEPVIRTICSRRIDMAREAARMLGAPMATDDWRDVMRDPEIDVVSICTPNALHVSMALEALRAGKHVYIDKPIAMNADEASEIAEAARLCGKKLMVVHNNRFFPSTLRAKELIAEGRIGNVISFRCDYLHSGSVDAKRPVGWKQLGEGGVLLDLMSHALDLTSHLAGDVREVLCETRVLYPERPTADGGVARNLSEDQAIAMVVLKNGAVGTLEASKIATGTDDELSFAIYGDKGALRWHLMRPDYLEFFDNTLAEAPLGGARGFTSIACGARYPKPGGQFLPIKNTIGWDRAHMHCYYSFLDAIARDLPVSPDADEALRLMRVLDAMKRSQAERRWVSVD